MSEIDMERLREAVAEVRQRQVEMDPIFAGHTEDGPEGRLVRSRNNILQLLAAADVLLARGERRAASEEEIRAACADAGWWNMPDAFEAGVRWAERHAIGTASAATAGEGQHYTDGYLDGFAHGSEGVGKPASAATAGEECRSWVGDGPTCEHCEARAGISEARRAELRDVAEALMRRRKLPPNERTFDSMQMEPDEVLALLAAQPAPPAPPPAPLSNETWRAGSRPPAPGASAIPSDERIRNEARDSYGGPPKGWKPPAPGAGEKP